MGYSQTYDSSAAFYLKFVGSNSPLVEYELQIGGTRSRASETGFGFSARRNGPTGDPLSEFSASLSCEIRRAMGTSESKIAVPPIRPKSLKDSPHVVKGLQIGGTGAIALPYLSS